MVLSKIDGLKKNEFEKALTQRRVSCIKKLSGVRSQEVSYYRFLNNPKVKEQDLIDSICSETANKISGGHVLALQDTSEFNFQWNKKRKKESTGLGPCRATGSLGFLLHPTLALNADTLEVYGFSHIQMWHREKESGTKYDRRYQSLPVKSKESYKWIESSLKSGAVLQNADKVTVIEDREGDIYSQFCEVPQDNIHLLIRNSQNRRLDNGKTLHRHLEELSVQGTYKLEVMQKNASELQKREVLMQVKYDEVTLLKPTKQKDEMPNQVSITVVSVEEVNPCDPTQTIRWRLLTTHKVESLPDAIQIVKWYSMRWYIEQLFRVLKRKGFQIERSELESGWAIRKLTVLAMKSALTIMNLKLALQEKNETTAEQTFNTQQLNCLQYLNGQYQGKTVKQQNQYKAYSLAWVAWIFARIGGWKGYESQRPPGFITIKEGLERFDDIYKGFALFNDKTVCTP